MGTLKTLAYFLDPKATVVANTRRKIDFFNKDIVLPN